MPELNDIGREVVLAKRSTGREFYGTVEDVNDDGYVIKVQTSATLYIDTRYDSGSWELVRFIENA